MQVLQQDQVMTGPRALWRSRDFLALWWGQVVSHVGTAMSDFALPLLVLTLTRSPTQAGIVTAVEKIPYFVLAIPAGAILDRIDRQRVMVVCNVLRFVLFGAVAGYLASGGRSLLVLASLVFVSGAGFVFFDIADNAAFPRLVPDSELARACGWVEGTTATSKLVGPALGGLVIGAASTVAVGTGYIYGLDAVSYLVSGIAIWLIRTSLVPTVAPGPRPPLYRSAWEGAVYLVRHQELRRLALANFFNCFLLTALTLSFITEARQEFGLSSSLMGVSLALGAGGGVIGSFFTGTLEHRLSARRVMLLAGVAWVIGEILFTITPSLAILIVAFGVMSSVRPVYFSTLYAHRNRLMTEEIRGRANSMYRMCAQAAEPLGLTTAGILITLVGARLYAVIAAATFLAVVLVAHRDLAGEAPSPESSRDLMAS